MARLEIMGAPPSTYTRVARMAALEKAVPFDFTPAMPHSPEVKAIHPAGKVPVMRHGGVTMFETRAIVHYIDETFDGPPLMPGTAAGDSAAEQWISYINTVSDGVLIRRYLFSYRYPKTPDKKPDRAAIDAMLPEVAREIAAFDRAIDGSGHLAGGRYSLADMFLMPILHYVRQTPEGGETIGKAKNLPAYFERHAQRESFQATMPPPPPGG